MPRKRDPITGKWPPRVRKKAPMPEPDLLPDEPVSPAPTLAPLPTPAGGPHVPAYTPFRYQTLQPLSPQELDLISTFHATYMQGPGIGNDAHKYQQARRDATLVLPLLAKQFTLACTGVDGPQSQEAQQVQRNKQWVEALLAQEG